MANRLKRNIASGQTVRILERDFTCRYGSDMIADKKRWAIFGNWKGSKKIRKVYGSLIKIPYE